ncbi:MAG: Hint domain-containing protein [Rhodobacteraceae bacterium]|nr:Hint domain-containing protein [Paracoccaceae bacterium]
MKTGFRGTFVISWSQTELDGRWSAPAADLRTGTVWNWSGDAVRVDGPADVLPLGDATGMVEKRKRAAHLVRRLLLAAGARASLPADSAAEGTLLEDQSFTVTDGREVWTGTLISTGLGRPPLVMFLDKIPPKQLDLWVVSHNVDLERRDQGADMPGGVICFTPGTMIMTEDGPKAVETLGEGDRLQTKDNGCEAILWTGRRRVTGARLVAMPNLTPIRLMEGALDKGVPDDGLLVSPDHRMVMRGPRARALFNVDEVLVTARDLVNGRTVLRDRSVREVTYIHLLLPRHQILFANGVETESFHPASAALASMEDAQLDALLARLPEVGGDPHSYGGYARRVLASSEAAILRGDMAA